jgi:lipoate-protein ligase A
MDAVQSSFEEEFKISFMEDRPDMWEQESIKRLVNDRYTNPDWIFSHKHPRARMGVGRIKTRGGLVEVYLSLSGGSIENVIITGDFFSSGEDINLIEKALQWTSASKERIEENLSGVWREDMIFGLDVPTLTSAILKAKENQVRL